MTHDELLAKMSKPAHNLNANDARNVYLLALRAVVELHYPYEVDGIQNNCHECDWAYPCFTIKAIKENLG